MKTKLASILTLAAAAALAVTAVAGGDEPTSTDPSSERRALGKVVASDTAKQHPEAAVARAKIPGSEIGKVSWQITTKPSGLVVENAFIVRCQKGFLFDYFPGPGDLRTTKEKTPISGDYPIPLADPDLCDFQVAGLIPGESEKRGRVITRIYNK